MFYNATNFFCSFHFFSGASCIRKDWKQIMNSTDFEQIYSPSDLDYNNLGKTILSTMNIILDLECRGLLPSYDDAIAILKSENDQENIRLARWEFPPSSGG